MLMLAAVQRHRNLLSQFHSVSKRLRLATNGDVLLVEPRSPAARAAASAGEQLAHQA